MTRPSWTVTWAVWAATAVTENVVPMSSSFAVRENDQQAPLRRERVVDMDGERPTLESDDFAPSFSLPRPLSADLRPDIHRVYRCRDGVSDGADPERHSTQPAGSPGWRAGRRG